jgi:hypothetical protein
MLKNSIGGDGPTKPKKPPTPEPEGYKKAPRKTK